MSPRPVVVRCRAKINTRLSVLGRRPDGYHQLDTEFVGLELHDVLRIEPQARRGFRLRCTGHSAGRPADNLVLAAARALQAHVGPERLPGARFELEKRIPVAAGLGGGSSDAAGALLGLAAAFGLEVAAPVLARLAIDLGSDVPYFLHGGRQRGRDRGEALEPLPDLPDTQVLIVRMPFGLSTRRVFERHAERVQAALASSLTTRKIGTSFDPEPGHAAGPPHLQNDLWEAAVDLAPGLARVRQVVESAFPDSPVGMTGSGPTLFALLPGASAARSFERRLARLRGTGAEPLLTRTLGAAEHRASRFEEQPG